MAVTLFCRFQPAIFPGLNGPMRCFGPRNDLLTEDKNFRSFTDNTPSIHPFPSTILRLFDDKHFHTLTFPYSHFSHSTILPNLRSTSVAGRNVFICFRERRELCGAPARCSAIYHISVSAVIHPL